MNMMTMNAESLSKDLNESVPELYVLIAKNAVAGIDSQGIAELMGVSRAEVDEITETQLYKDCRLLLAQEFARGRMEADFSWDSLEQHALKNLSKRIQFEQDPEFNLKVAVMANKAQRRITGGKEVLDPSQGGVRVPLNLTSRIVKRLNQKTGEASIEETRTVSLTDGSAVNPSFEDIDKMFGVSARPAIAANATSRTQDADFTVDDLAEQWLKNKM